MTMKKLSIITLLAALPLLATAQMDKRVEVTKEYVPSVERAAKLRIAPDMTDTARMRPEIDYTVTPLVLRTALQTEPIRPTQVTYWEFNRPTPFYLKVGAGIPLNSVADFYYATQHAGTGYVVASLNHEGRYADLKNDFGLKHGALRMNNRVGAAAGKYLGRHVLEGDISYTHRLFDRYGAYADPSEESRAASGRSGYGDARFALRIGDDFLNLERFNFEVELHGALYDDRSKWADLPRRGGETVLGASARIARGSAGHSFALGAGYERMAGRLLLDGQLQQQIHASLRYGYQGRSVAFEAGADYYHDRVEGVEGRNYVLPFLRLTVDLGTGTIQPFLEADGGVYANDLRRLTGLCPVARPQWLAESSVDYNFRLGLGGSLWRDLFDYRIYAAFTVHDNRLFWTVADRMLLPSTGRLTETSFNGEAEFRPLSSLRFTLELHGMLYNNESDRAHGAPTLRGDFGVRYAGRKVGAGLRLEVESNRSWTLMTTDSSVGPVEYTLPYGWDLGVDFDWKVTGRATLFVEGRNLLNRKLYEWPLYPGDGVLFTVGARLNF